MYRPKVVPSHVGKRWVWSGSRFHETRVSY